MALKITILVDNPKSWILPFAKRLVQLLKMRGHIARLVHESKKIPYGDIAVFLSSEEIVSKKILRKNKHNIVPHSSKLPKGRGWSPLTWQILAGKNKIANTLLKRSKNQIVELYTFKSLWFFMDMSYWKKSEKYKEKSILSWF